MSQCKCDLKTKLVGDGCRYCNPQEYIDNLIESLEEQRTWVGLMRGVRVEGDTVVISIKGGNDAARELCGALIEEMNR